MAGTVLNLSSGRRNGPSVCKHISHWCQGCRWVLKPDSTGHLFGVRVVLLRIYDGRVRSRLRDIVYIKHCSLVAVLSA